MTRLRERRRQRALEADAKRWLRRLPPMPRSAYVPPLDHATSLLIIAIISMSGVMPIDVQKAYKEGKL
jgi:hypothetical protein